MAVIEDYSPIYAGDTASPLVAQFSYKDGSAVNLTGATISMKMEDSAGNEKAASGTWTIDDVTGGNAHYNYANADVNEVGMWTLFITITIGGKPEHADERLLEIKHAP
jgi:hypothetical protein